MTGRLTVSKIDDYGRTIWNIAPPIKLKTLDSSRFFNADEDVIVDSLNEGNTRNTIHIEGITRWFDLDYFDHTDTQE